MTIPKSHIRTILSTAETERANAVAGLSGNDENLELSIIDKVIALCRSVL